MVFLCLSIECDTNGMVLVNNGMKNIIKIVALHGKDIMSGSINMAMNMPSYSMSDGHNSSPKRDNNNSNINIDDGVERRETCESIGSKSNNTFVYSHLDECDHDDSKVMKPLNELEKEQNTHSGNNSNNNNRITLVFLF